jgi:hypothetical protein
MERLEAEHWPCDPLDEAVVLLNYVVEVFRLNDTDRLTNSREFEDDVSERVNDFETVAFGL